MTTALLLFALGAAQADPPQPPVEAARIEAERHALEAERQALRDEIRSLREEISRVRDDAAGDGAERTGFGTAVTVAEGEEVAEVVSFGDDVNVAGHVLGDAVSFGGNVVIARTGRVDGDAVSFGGRVEVQDGGRLQGDRVAMGIPTGLAPLPITPVQGDDPDSTSLGSLTLGTDARELFHSLYRKAVWLLSIAGAGVLVIGLFPKRVGRVAQDLEARPVRAAVVGTLATGFLTVFSLLFTVVTLGLGLPVGFLLMGLLGIAWLLGFVGFCQAVGDRLPFEERPHGRWLAFLVGVFLLTFFGSLPWIGWLVVGAASVVGIGAAFSTRFGRA